MSEFTASGVTTTGPFVGARKVMEFRRILEYAETKYHCEFPMDFKRRMIREVLDDKHKSCKVPKEKAIDALAKEWEIWKPYVSAESFTEFIADGIKSIFEIEVSATFHADSLNGYIGNKAKVIRKLPNVLSTWVSSNGVLCVDGKRVAI